MEEINVNIISPIEGCYLVSKYEDHFEIDYAVKKNVNII